MVKGLFGIVIAALILLPSCAHNDSTQNALEDSARIADSIAQVEAAAEQARLDSIRQDSIALEEKLNLAQKSLLTMTTGLRRYPNSASN